MVGIQLNSDELNALAGLPSLHVHLYVLAIRQKMDFKSGIVGAKKGCYISWQYLHEAVWINPEAGITYKQPTKNQLRRAVKKLEKKGLLTVLSDEKHLVFKCLLAITDNSAQNQADRKTTPRPTEKQHPQNPLKSSLELVDNLPGRHTLNAQADIHPYAVKDIKKKDNTIVLSKKESARRKQLPPNFEVTEHHMQLAFKNQWPNPHDEIQAFKDYHEGRGNVMLDWDKAFYTWLRNAKKFNKQGAANAVNAGSSAVRTISSSAANLLRVLQHTYKPTQSAG